MTVESTEIAAMVDRFPKDIRPRLRDALLRIAEVYVVSGVAMEPTPRKECAPELKGTILQQTGAVADVISLAARRALRA